MTRLMFRIMADYLWRSMHWNIAVLIIVIFTFCARQDSTILIYMAFIFLVLGDLLTNRRQLRALPMAHKDFGRVFWMLCVVCPGVLSMGAYLLSPALAFLGDPGRVSLTWANLGLSIWINSVLAGSMMFIRIYAIKEQIKVSMSNAVIRCLAYLCGLALYVGMYFIKKQFPSGFEQLNALHWLVLGAFTALTSYAWIYAEHLVGQCLKSGGDVASMTQASQISLPPKFKYKGFRFLWWLQLKRCSNICLGVVVYFLFVVLVNSVYAKPNGWEPVISAFDNPFILLLLVLLFRSLLDIRTMRLLPVSPHRLAMHSILTVWSYGLVAILAFTAIQLCFLPVSVVTLKLLNNLLLLAIVPLMSPILILYVHFAKAIVQLTVATLVMFVVVLKVMPGIMADYGSLNGLPLWIICLSLNAASFGINYWIVKRSITHSSSIYRSMNAQPSFYYP